jgi:hypothetical protein
MFAYHDIHHNAVFGSVMFPHHRARYFLWAVFPNPQISPKKKKKALKEPVVPV